MKFNFPAIKSTRDVRQSAQKVQDELNEFIDELEKPSDKLKLECIDILHTAESLMRKVFESEDEMDEFIKKVYDKNKNRGYYDKFVF